MMVVVVVIIIIMMMKAEKPKDPERGWGRARGGGQNCDRMIKVEAK